MSNDSSTSSLEEGRRGYASSKVAALSSQLQETSVAKFEVDHLPERREVGFVLVFRRVPCALSGNCIQQA